MLVNYLSDPSKINLTEFTRALIMGKSHKYLVWNSILPLEEMSSVRNLWEIGYVAHEQWSMRRPEHQRAPKINYISAKSHFSQYTPTTFSARLASWKLLYTPISRFHSRLDLSRICVTASVMHLHVYICHICLWFHQFHGRHLIIPAIQKLASTVSTSHKNCPKSLFFSPCLFFRQKKKTAAVISTHKSYQGSASPSRSPSLIPLGVEIWDCHPHLLTGPVTGWLPMWNHSRKSNTFHTYGHLVVETPQKEKEFSKY